ncbi:hypothetical protein ABIA30_000954 [Mycobacterium sp. MAA66]
MLGDFGATMRKPENCLTPQHVVDLMSVDGTERLCSTTLFTEARHGGAAWRETGLAER